MPWYSDIHREQWRTLIAAQMGWMLDAMDVMLYAFALTAVRDEFRLSSAQAGVLATMPPDFDFDLKFNVTEYTVMAVVQGFVQERKVKGNTFNQEVKNLVNNLSKGSPVYIQDIKAVGPDGSVRDLSTINFKLN